MRGNSKLDLRPGMSFSMLYEEESFRKWFTKMLDGGFSKYDFDTLPFNVLESLTSPNKPGSLASENPAGMNPSAGPSINNVLAIAPAENGSSLDQTASHGPDALTFQALLDASASKSEDRPANQGTAAVGKEKNATRVQGDLQVAGRSAPKSSTPAQASGNSTTSTKRQTDSALKSSLDKRRKIGSTDQLPEIIDLSTDDDGNVTVVQQKTQSAGYAANEPSATTLSPSNVTPGSRNVRNDTDIIGQNRRLMEENEMLKQKLSESFMGIYEALVRQDERLMKENERLIEEIERSSEEIRRLTQDIARLIDLIEKHKMSELQAVTRETEASVKMEGLNREIQKLREENAYQKSVMATFCPNDVLDEGKHLRDSQIKEEDHAEQREE